MHKETKQIHFPFTLKINPYNPLLRPVCACGERYELTRQQGLILTRAFQTIVGDTRAYEIRIIAKQVRNSLLEF